MNDILEDLCETTYEVDYYKQTEEMMKDSWTEVENSPPHRFVSCFEKFKQEQIKHKLAWFAKDKVGIKGIYL